MGWRGAGEMGSSALNNGRFEYGLDISKKTRSYITSMVQYMDQYFSRTVLLYLSWELLYRVIGKRHCLKNRLRMGAPSLGTVAASRMAYTSLKDLAKVKAVE